MFKLKLRELLNGIFKTHVLGKPLAHVYTIEFQKRDLPHAHILIILADGCKAREPSDYDKIVCTEIPDPNIDPIFSPTLHRIVKRCMIHGPCGIVKKGAPCMRDGSCFKQFPRNSLTQLLPPKMVTHYIFERQFPYSRSRRDKAI